MGWVWKEMIPTQVSDNGAGQHRSLRALGTDWIPETSAAALLCTHRMKLPLGRREVVMSIPSMVLPASHVLAHPRTGAGLSAVGNNVVATLQFPFTQKSNQHIMKSPRKVLFSLPSLFLFPFLSASFHLTSTVSCVALEWGTVRARKDKWFTNIFLWFLVATKIALQKASREAKRCDCFCSILC